MLLPKLHEKRCVLYFDKLHEPKQAKKKTKHYRLSSNRAFHEVMQVRQTYWLRRKSILLEGSAAQHST